MTTTPPDPRASTHWPAGPLQSLDPNRPLLAGGLASGQRAAHPDPVGPAGPSPQPAGRWRAWPLQEYRHPCTPANWPRRLVGASQSDPLVSLTRSPRPPDSHNRSWPAGQPPGGRAWAKPERSSEVRRPRHQWRLAIASWPWWPAPNHRGCANRCASRVHVPAPTQTNDAVRRPRPAVQR